MSVQEVESMTLAQKRMAAMIMENTVEDIEAHRARQAEAEALAAAAAQSVGKVSVVDEVEEDAAMEESDDEMNEERRRQEEAERQKELARAHALQPAVGPMKIRTDYVPKSTSQHYLSFDIRAELLSLCFSLSSRREEHQTNDDHLFHLWSANTRGRTAGTHAD